MDVYLLFRYHDKVLVDTQAYSTLQLAYDHAYLWQSMAGERRTEVRSTKLRHA
jgi:hypothetical protein